MLHDGFGSAADLADGTPPKGSPPSMSASDPPQSLRRSCCILPIWTKRLTVEPKQVLGHLIGTHSSTESTLSTEKSRVFDIVPSLMGIGQIVRIVLFLVHSPVEVADARNLGQLVAGIGVQLERPRLGSAKVRRGQMSVLAIGCRGITSPL